MENLVTITLLNIVLLAGLLMLQPLVRTVNVGLLYALSSLDKRVDEGTISRRLAMVTNNQIEALTLWVPTVLIAQSTALSHPHLSLTGTVFLLARVAYAMISLAGLPFLRTASWLIGFVSWAYLAWIVWAAL